MQAPDRTLSILSIVTLIVLPMTPIPGIFGTDLGGLPASQDRWASGTASP